MAQNQIGCQTIGCHVKSCKYNDRGAYCELTRIEVEPCHDGSCGTGKPADESLCGSYRPR